MPISDHVTVVREAVAEARERIAAARARGGHGQDVTLVAVTKTHGPEAVEAAYAAGVKDVGENRVQEAERKMAQVTVPVRWHLIGHLQTNKASQVHRFHLLHSLDRDRLADALQEAMQRRESVLDVLVQVNVSGEASKGGYEPEALPALVDRLHGLRNLRVRGVMTMAPFDADEATLRRVFGGAREARETLRRGGHEVPVLSMGMSSDFEIAVEEGATHVRLGTMLFGQRG